MQAEAVSSDSEPAPSASSAAVEPGAELGRRLPAAVRWRILGYVGTLTILMGFAAPHGGLIYIPISFILKNKLHLSAHEVADFRLFAGLPLYLAALFGLARDALDPLGMRDRGFLMMFGGTGTLTYLAFAFMEPSYVGLMVAFGLLTASYLFLSSAMRGLTSLIGQNHAISGQVSVAWTIVTLVPALSATLLGGKLSQELVGDSAGHAVRVVFSIGAMVMLVVSAFATLKPKSVFDGLRYERARRISLGDLRQLLTHRAIYPTLAISLLWYFMPGAGTPLQFYFQNTLGGTDAQWGQWNAIADAANVPALLGFGYFCRKVPLRKLLWWGTLLGIPQLVPLLFIRSVNGGLVAAVPFGFMSGVATVAYLDLMIRACPRGLQGTVLMTFYCLESIAARFGDALGTRLYDYAGGFPACVAASVAASALILPLLLLLPKELVSTTDEQPIAG